MADDTVIGKKLGTVTEKQTIEYKEHCITMEELSDIYENKLESVYSCNIPSENKDIPKFEYTAKTYPKPAIKLAKPKVLIPVFPGTNCEYGSARAVRLPKTTAEIFII